MRKTFIEAVASDPDKDRGESVSSAYAEDFHWGPLVMWLMASSMGISSAYAEDFHWGQGKGEFILSFGFFAAYVADFHL